MLLELLCGFFLRSVSVFGRFKFFINILLLKMNFNIGRLFGEGFWEIKG